MSFKDKINESIEEKIYESLFNLQEKRKMDPVGKADADIDNDGDVDDSDEYLHNRRKAIKKAMKEEEELDLYQLLDSLDEHQLAEISAKLARRAAASSQAKSFEYGSSAYGPGTDKESDRLERKADKARAHVQKRQGDKGVMKVDKMTGKLIYGEAADLIDSLDEAQLDEISKELARRAVAGGLARSDRHFDKHGFTHHGAWLDTKSNKAARHLAKRHGEKEVDRAVRDYSKKL